MAVSPDTPTASREHAELVAALSAISTSIATLRGELRLEIATLGGELRAEMATLGGSLREDIATLRGALHTEVATLTGRLSLTCYRLLVSLGGAIVVVGGLVLAVLRLLPSAHVGG